MYQDYVAFSKDVLKITFKDIELLITAFTHRSYLNEHKKSAKEHNERLEFLGDAVLELVVTEYLFKTFSEPEGILTNWRSALVRTESISAAADKMGFSEYLRLSKGEKQGGERARQQILANTFEAVTGAIYIDQGYDAAKTFITDHIIATLKEILETGSWRDAKSHFQEIAQAKTGLTPSYKVLSEDGPDHDKTFQIGVYLGADLYGKGEGHSKQSAQQVAAQQGIDKIEGRLRE